MIADTTKYTLIRRRHVLVGGAACMAWPAQATTLTACGPKQAAVAGLRPELVASALDAGAEVPGLRAVLASQQGNLLAERYYGGANTSQLQAINSVTKSVVALLVGQALRDGRLKSLDQTVAELLPEAIAAAPGSVAAPITLGQILSGRTGQAFDFMRYRELLGAKPLLPFLLSRPHAPVTSAGWSYNDAMVALLAAVLDRAYGGADLAVLAQNQLFQPLGIDSFSWQRDRDGNPLAPGGLALRPRDLLKLAELMAFGGRWGAQQVVPQAWVASCITPLGAASWQVAPVLDVAYGQLWFTGQLHGQRVAWAWGYGGQFALLAPALGLCVATAATSPHPGALREQTNAIMAVVAQIVGAAS